MAKYANQTKLRGGFPLSYLASNEEFRWNAAECARAMGVSESTTRRYLDLLSDAFMVRQLQPCMPILANGRLNRQKYIFTIPVCCINY